MNTVEYVQQFPVKEFQAGELLLQEGDDATCLMAIREGFVKITAISDAGIERLLWIAGRYDVTPVERLFSKNTIVRYFYTALTSGSYYAVDKATFLATAFTHPELMTEIARGMSSHYDDLLDRINTIDTATVEERLVRTLCYLAERFSSADTIDLYKQGLRLTHQDLASMIGSTRETVSLILNQLRREGVIEYGKRRFVVTPGKLMKRIETANGAIAVQTTLTAKTAL